ncbi:hypothetical protein F2Q69_00013147 [Brassica cretica]|uniref:Uncharacterized protein n=1 Tax=Brassica cretica TaxID=69181 RepID=A0A8S9R624_BRACR|nr:hypothetical protein F2Q69_00013147 [Brassica cretica]
MHGLMSYRCSEGFNRYIATELWLEPGCYVATERDERLVATWRPSGTSAWSLRSDRAFVATERDECSVAT